MFWTVRRRFLGNDCYTAIKERLTSAQSLHHEAMHTSFFSASILSHCLLELPALNATNNPTILCQNKPHKMMI